VPIINSTTTDVTVRGKRLRVAVRAANGAGPPRPPLLLLSGLGARLEVLDPLVEQLPPELEIIRLDVPGVGASPAPALPYHYARLASLIAAPAWAQEPPAESLIGPPEILAANTSRVPSGERITPLPALPG